MSDRELHRTVDDLLAGRRPRPFTASDFDAAQLATAIDLVAAREGADEPRPEFTTGLKALLVQDMSGDQGSATPMRARSPSSTRRQVIAGTAAAATAAVASVAVDRLLFPARIDQGQVAQGGAEMMPTEGAWRAVVDSSALLEGAVHSFDLDSVTGFVRRVEGRVQAVSGACTHQGCKLWFDQSADRLRCPCHSTSFSPAGQVITHALPIAPKPLPHFEVRERGGVIEVLAPPSHPA